jgi:hypothetical protein
MQRSIGMVESPWGIYFLCCFVAPHLLRNIGFKTEVEILFNNIGIYTNMWHSWLGIDNLKMFIPPFACSQKVKVSETGYHQFTRFARLFILFYFIPPRLYLKENIYEHSTEGKSKGGYGEKTQMRTNLGERTSLVPCSFPMYCSYPHFWFCPRLWQNWGPVPPGWGTSHP